MAHHASAEKRTRQSEKQNLRNRANLSTMKTEIKKVLEAVAKKDFSQIDELLRKAQSVIAKTRQKGAIHKNNMARRIGRLNAFVNKARG